MPAQQLSSGAESAPRLSNVDRARVLLKLAELNPYLWRCDRVDCDGKPHDKYFHPHAQGGQLLDGHSVVFMRSGRGRGKTRAGAQRVAERMLATPKHGVLIMADTKAKAIALCIEALFKAFPPYAKPKFNPHTGKLRISNGSWAIVFGANDKDDIERPRGFESGTLWMEECGAWRYQMPAWNNMVMANRSMLGNVEPQIIVTTTPRNVPIIKMLNKWAEEGNCKLITGSTFDNQDNLASTYIDMMKRQYGDSSIGRQELYGEMVEDVRGALWTSELLERCRVLDHPPFVKTIIAVDPSGGGASECGIVVAGLSALGRVFIVEDASGHMPADVWAKEAIRLYYAHEADAIVTEVNFGADLVANTIKAIDHTVHVREVRAYRGKQRRAEPVVALFNEGKVYLVGNFGLLESQLTSWIPPGQYEEDADGILVPIEPSTYSPDRLDSMVWSCFDLLLKPKHATTYMRMS